MTTEHHDLPELDVASIEDWNEAEHMPIIRSVLRLGCGMETESTIIRTTGLHLPPIEEATIVWQVSDRAWRIPIDVAVDLVVDLTVEGFLFAITEEAGELIKDALKGEHEDKLKNAEVNSRGQYAGYVRTRHG